MGERSGDPASCLSEDCIVAPIFALEKSPRDVGNLRKVSGECSACFGRSNNDGDDSDDAGANLAAVVVVAVAGEGEGEVGYVFPIGGGVTGSSG